MTFNGLFKSLSVRQWITAVIIVSLSVVACEKTSNRRTGRKAKGLNKMESEPCKPGYKRKTTPNALPNRRSNIQDIADSDNSSDEEITQEELNSNYSNLSPAEKKAQWNQNRISLKKKNLQNTNKKMLSDCIKIDESEKSKNNNSQSNSEDKENLSGLSSENQNNPSTSGKLGDETNTGNTQGAAGSSNGKNANGEKISGKDSIEASSTQRLSDLQELLSQLSNEVYLNAWYSVTGDNSSHPRTFFEEVASKIKKAGTIPSIPLSPNLSKDSYREKCGTFSLIETFDPNNKTKHELFDCRSEIETHLMAYENNGDEWNLSTTKIALENVLQNQLGFLSTISFQPTCSFSTQREDETPRIMTATCKDWGHELYASKMKNKKTFLFSMIRFNRAAQSEVFDVEANQVDFNGNNQICFRGKIKRTAPASQSLIFKNDEDQESCNPIMDDPKIPTSPQTPVNADVTNIPAADQAMDPRIAPQTQNVTPETPVNTPIDESVPPAEDNAQPAVENNSTNDANGENTGAPTTNTTPVNTPDSSKVNLNENSAEFTSNSPQGINP